MKFKDALRKAWPAPAVGLLCGSIAAVSLTAAAPTGHHMTRALITGGTALATGLVLLAIDVVHLMREPKP